MNAAPENSTTLEEVPTSVNLMGEGPKEFSVSVNDEDRTNVPADLGPQETVPFWKKSDVRMWMYILGGTILIFLIVFTILSQQTSLFRGYLLDSGSDNSSNSSDEDIFGGFNDSASDDEPVGGGNDDEEPVTDDAAGNDENSDDIFGTGSGAQPSDDEEDIVGGGGDNSPIIDDEDFGDGSGAQPSDDEEDLVFNDDNEEDLFLGDDLFIDDIGSLLSDVPGDIPPIFDQPDTQSDNGSGLGSNTNATVMSSPDVQGDTGPAAGVALIPTAIYAFVRRRKR